MKKQFTLSILAATTFIVSVSFSMNFDFPPDLPIVPMGLRRQADGKIVLAPFDEVALKFDLKQKVRRPAALPVSRKRISFKPDLSSEYLEKIFWPIAKCETEENILFFGTHRATAHCGSQKTSEPKIKAVFNKETGKIHIDQIHYPNPGLISVSRSHYNNYPEETYNALQDLYEKQQEERKQNS